MKLTKYKTRKFKKSFKISFPLFPKMNKRAIHIWVSWVLLMAFVIALSALMFEWTTSYTEEKSVELQKRTYDTTECAHIGLNIDYVCQDTTDTQVLYINITNTNDIAVDKLIFRFFDIHDVNVETKEQTLKLKPGKSERLKILKQGTLKRAEVIPIIFKDDYEVVCREKIAYTESINEC